MKVGTWHRPPAKKAGIDESQLPHQLRRGRRSRLRCAPRWCDGYAVADRAGANRRPPLPPIKRSACMGAANVLCPHGANVLPTCGGGTATTCGPAERISSGVKCSPLAPPPPHGGVRSGRRCGPRLIRPPDVGGRGTWPGWKCGAKPPLEVVVGSSPAAMISVNPSPKENRLPGLRVLRFDEALAAEPRGRSTGCPIIQQKNLTLPSFSPAAGALQPCRSTRAIGGEKPAIPSTGDGTPHRGRSSLSSRDDPAGLGSGDHRGKLVVVVSEETHFRPH
jgi:hypothetical protein